MMSAMEVDEEMPAAADNVAVNQDASQAGQQQGSQPAVDLVSLLTSLFTS